MLGNPRKTTFDGQVQDPALLQFVDFDGLRLGASATDLPFPPSTARVERIPLPDASDLPPGGAAGDYLQRLLDRLEGLPAVLVGYCVGASIAVQLAAGLESIHGRPLTVALIDPAEVTRSSIREEADLLLARLTVGASPTGVTELPEIAAELDWAYGKYVEGQAPRTRGMLEEMRAETLGRYRAWLAFVAAAAGRVHRRLDSPLHVIFSSEGASEGLPNWLDAPASVAHLDVERDDLLASAQAAQRLLEIASSSAGWSEARHREEQHR